MSVRVDSNYSIINKTKLLSSLGSEYEECEQLKKYEIKTKIERGCECKDQAHPLLKRLPKEINRLIMN